MLEQTIQIVQKASKIFVEGYHSKKDINFKGKKDLVTQYDVAVENYLKEQFSKEFPQFNIIAEESNNDAVQFDNSIIIDPIDGTTNFVNNVPHCAISVGIYKNKQPFIGVVYNPILDELYSAKIGHGAYLNGNKINVSSDEELQTSLIATGFPYSNATNQDDLDFVLRNLKSVLPQCQDIRRLGSASIDLCMVAKGVFEGYYEINLKPWDVAAGIIILQEASGKFTNENGKKYDMFKDRCIVASNGKIHEKLVSLIQ